MSLARRNEGYQWCTLARLGRMMRECQEGFGLRQTIGRPPFDLVCLQWCIYISNVGGHGLLMVGGSFFNDAEDLVDFSCKEVETCRYCSIRTKTISIFSLVLLRSTVSWLLYNLLNRVYRYSLHMGYSSPLDPNSIHTVGSVSYGDGHLVSAWTSSSQSLLSASKLQEITGHADTNDDSRSHDWKQ